MEIRSFAPSFRFFYLLLIFGCTGCIQTTEMPLKVHMDASRHLNPDVTSASLPLRLSIYQLADTTEFEEASFRQLWKNDKQVLGSAMLDKKEITINPGESRDIKINRKPEATHVGVVALFRKHDEQGWKSVKPLPNKVNALFSKVYIAAKGREVEVR